MIAVWMLYCVGIGLVFVVVGVALERAFQFAGRSTRWAWVIALVGTYLIPVAAWVRPDAFATSAAPIPLVTQSGPSLPTPTTSTNLDQPPPSAFSLSDLDLPLRWAWGMGSLAMLLALLTAATRLMSLRRGWRHAAVDGRQVLVSSNIGPAVVGLWAPRVVLPEWALQLSDRERELMLAHEEQHVRARDPVVLAAALGAVLVAPWNLALWWQWRRLRLAVEIDCDARVLAQGRSAPAYGELLLRVGGERSLRIFGVAAFGEPVSFLESRLRRMVTSTPRWRWLGAAAAVVVAIGALIVACETPRPLAPVESSPIPSANALRARDFSDGLSIRESERLRSAIERYARSNTARMMGPSLLEPSGPPMSVYLIADRKLQVYRSSTATLYYLGNARPTSEIGAADLKSAAPFVDPGTDGWLVVDPQALRGLVRNNVRVIWIHHDPAPQDTAVTPAIRLYLRDQTDDMKRRGELLSRPSAIRLQENRGLSTIDSGISLPLEQTREQLRWAQRDDALRTIAQQSEPAAFAGARDAIALILDSNHRLVAHASGTREPGDRLCADVLTRLLPAYRNTRFPISGCLYTKEEGRVTVYWGQLPTR